MRKLFLVTIVLAAGCTAQQRQDVADNVATYTGAADSSVPAIVEEIGKDIVDTGFDAEKLIFYGGGLLAAVVAGLVGKKIAKAKKAKAK